MVRNAAADRTVAPCGTPERARDEIPHEGARMACPGVHMSTEEKNIDTQPWREGSISVEIFDNRVKVFVERSGRMIPVIATYHGGITSHCVHSGGIDKCIEEYAKEGP
jgi:hypothetical protein